MLTISNLLYSKLSQNQAQSSQLSALSIQSKILFLELSLRSINQSLFIFLNNLFSKMKESKCGNFVAKLHSLLNSCRYDSVIAWADSHTAIEILDDRKMEVEILPVYFRQSKFESFVRQLNLYGFKKLKSQQTTKFTHPLLQEGCSLSSISTVKSCKMKKEDKGEQLQQEKKCQQEIEKENKIMDECADGNIAINDILGENRSSTIQVQNTINPQQINLNSMFALPTVIYFPFNPYFAWNFMELFNNLENKKLSQILSNGQELPSN